MDTVTTIRNDKGGLSFGKIEKLSFIRKIFR